MLGKLEYKPPSNQNDSHLKAFDMQLFLITLNDLGYKVVVKNLEHQQSKEILVVEKESILNIKALDKEGKTVSVH